MEDISIFITACILNQTQNYLLNECIKNIRKMFINKNPPPIYIIDDIKENHTNYLDIIEPLNINIHIIKSEIKQAGEALFLYYYHKLRPSKKALYIHDTMLLISPIDENIINNITTIKFISEFGSYEKLKEQDEFLIQLKEGEKLVELSNTSNWIGSYGGNCLITLDYLDHLENTYNILSLTDKYKTKKDRECYERVLGVVVCYDLKIKENLSIYCELSKIRDDSKCLAFNFSHYIYYNDLPFYKINFGR